jgi:phosphatidylserine/phosphatidylglycerophosphate/cardiolipin synthase-like enzyme
VAEIDDLMKQYFLVAGDEDPRTYPALPITYKDSRVTALVDMQAYADNLRKALLQVGGLGDFIYVAGWFLGLAGGPMKAKRTSTFFSVNPEITDYSEFFLDGPGGNESFISVLRQKAALGVDVRVLGWICTALNPETPDDEAMLLEDAVRLVGRWKVFDIAQINDNTVRSILALRAPSTMTPPIEKSLEGKTVLSTIGHMLGSVHTKMVVVGTTTNVVAFTGGIDFHMSRWGRPGHYPTNQNPPQDLRLWHDTACRIEGPAARDVYDWFFDMWMENVKKPAHDFLRVSDDFPFGQIVPSYLPGLTSISYPAPLLENLPVSGNHHVQSLRTVPVRDGRVRTWPFRGKTGVVDIAGFGINGLFEYARATRKAIAAATTYIYMEDQGFWSEKIMEWLSEAVHRTPQLRVILVTGGAADPTTAPPPESYLIDALNTLIEDLENDEIARIGFYEVDGTFVHSKATLIDDKWALIGSANKMRRSLYTDFEHCVAVIDEDGLFVKEFRKQLFSDHFQTSATDQDHPPAFYDDLQTALAAWNDVEGTRLRKRPLVEDKEGASGPGDKLLYPIIDPDSRIIDDTLHLFPDGWLGLCENVVLDQ